MAVNNQGEFAMDVRDAPPAHLLMKIESFNERSWHAIDKIESKEFVAANHKWKLIIYPQDSGRRSDASVILSVAEIETLPKQWEVTADFTILLHNYTRDRYFCFRGKAKRFDAKNSRWGFSISGKMLEEVSDADGSCTFGAEVFPRKSDVNQCLSFHV